MLFVNRRIADRKSLLTLTVAAVKRQVTVVLVPLVGLGSDQVAKSMMPDHNVEAYHVDEHKCQDVYDLWGHLLNMDDEERDNISIILYISPSTLCRVPLVSVRVGGSDYLVR